MIDRVLLDGHNLSFRCACVPGLSDLTDAKGRPTGVVFGFLRSLSAYRTRFPGSEIRVCWDGSSRRRRDAYEGYKAGRSKPAESTLDQMAFLREFLPSLGVHQSHHPDEEADDVIATLVRQRPVPSMIVSTDRDFLQLVTPTTILLVPAVGGRQEVLMDPDEVVRQYGVGPEHMLTLRSLMGDTSDNLPGVPRVPTKVLVALIKAHGTLDGIFASSLTGLTKAQYRQLRDAEPAVRRNYELMALRNVSDTSDVQVDVDRGSAEDELKVLGIDPTVIESFFLPAPSGFVKTS